MVVSKVQGRLGLQRPCQGSLQLRLSPMLLQLLLSQGQLSACCSLLHRAARSPLAPRVSVRRLMRALPSPHAV